MNERIRELAEQAGWMMSNEVEGFNTRLEKFAKLLVEECAKIAGQTPCPYEDDFAKQTYGHTWDMACVASSKEIKKYFKS